MRAERAERIRIVGSRCVLRDWALGDAEALRSLLDPRASWHDTNGPYLGRPTAEDMARVRDGYLALAAMPASEVPLLRASLAIADPATDAVLGCVSWYWESRETDWRRIGIVLYDDATRGRGIGREALGLWTDHLFAVTDALRLDLATYSGNVGMQRAAEAAGFTLEARMRAARRWSGGVHDALVYGVLREERVR